MQNPGKFDGPIPGENYTSNTKNYPWHRPPETADYVAVVDRAIKAFSKPEKIGMALTLLDSGETIKDFVTGNLRVAVAKGQVPIDAAILAAGPLAKYLDVLSKKAGVKADMGMKLQETIWTPARLKAFYGSEDGPEEATYTEVKKEAPAEEPEAGGLMSAPPKDPAAEQNAMLGGGEEGTL